MVVRAMNSERIFRQVSQCDKNLDFHPRAIWPRALPVLAWKGLQLCGFERSEGLALDLFAHNGCTWLEALTACHPSLGLGELARLHACLETSHPELAMQFNEALFAHFGLRWCERLQTTLRALDATPIEFQNWVDEKKPGTRELAPLLAVNDVRMYAAFLRALVSLPISKSQAMQALEWVIELSLMDRPLNDLMPSGDNATAYLKQLESWRRPRSHAQDEQWREVVTKWPWPSQVQGQWQRFGDQSGLEIKIRTTSPQDFHKKLERLLSIQGTWSSGN